MGLNLVLERVKPGQRSGDEIRTWDSARHAGDRDFNTYCSRENIIERPDPDYLGWGDVPIIYWRPKDLHAAEWWVRSHIDAGSQPRLLRAFEMMKEDDSIYFFTSW